MSEETLLSVREQREILQYVRDRVQENEIISDRLPAWLANLERVRQEAKQIRARLELADRYIQLMKKIIVEARVLPLPFAQLSALETEWEETKKERP